MNKKHKKDWFTLTKILTYIATALVVAVMVFTMWAIVRYEDTTPLMYLIPTTEALALAVWGLYIWRGRSEYKARMFAGIIRFLKKEGVEITPEMMNSFDVD